jgi:hypothetical protein
VEGDQYLIQFMIASPPKVTALRGKKYSGKIAAIAESDCVYSAKVKYDQEIIGENTWFSRLFYGTVREINHVREEDVMEWFESYLALIYT